MLKRKVTYDSRPYAKRARSGYAKKGMVRYKAPSTFNRCVIATVVDYDIALSADTGVGFGFSPTKLWVDGATSTAYTTDISGVWDLARVVKVEVTIMPNANSADFTTSGSSQIPYGYDCFDPNTGANPTLTSIKQNSSTKVFRCDQVRKRTIYPNFTPDAFVNVGQNRKDMFLSTYSDQPFYGYQVFLDVGAALTPASARVSFKVFLEVRASI